MKAIQYIIVFLLLLQVASAHEEHSCKPVNWTSKIRLLLDKEVSLKGGKLLIHSEDCTLTQNERFAEICNIGNTTVMVSDGNLPSVLVLRNGNIYKMDCRTPEQRQQQQQGQQQQQQQEQQDTQAGEGPGHGGNTMGGGHGKKGHE
jgi:hypothetical protein